MDPDHMDINELRKAMVGRAVVKETDMTGDMVSETQDVIVSGIENSSAPNLNMENAAKYIKENLDKKFGPFWHCILGEGFSFDVTVQKKSLFFMYYNGNIAVLVFKS